MAGVAAIQITAGGYHTCALVMGGGLQCWGANNEGQLGTGSSVMSQDVPVMVSLGAGVL
jgi:alpha-tubulin suppressor-like RCC1 family protein